MRSYPFIIILLLVLIACHTGCSGGDKVRGMGNGSFDSVEPNAPKENSETSTEGDGHGISGNTPKIYQLKSRSAFLFTGSLITLLGENFTPGLKVFIDDIECGSATVISQGELSCTMTGEVQEPEEIIFVVPSGGSIRLSSPPVTLSDHWTPTNLMKAPIPRSEASAVWTGSKVLVFGGQVGAETNTGASYDPVANAWSPLSILNAPQSRSHTAVWTGSKMITFGGMAGSMGSVSNIGGIYDPALDIWTVLPTLNAPSARHSHAAVWTGSKMIVFGGLSLGYHNDGGVYDPNSNLWSALPTLNAPTPRMAFSTVWTGTKILVFGGAGGPLNTGGSYDPNLGIWTALTTVNAPSVRFFHSAIWTGSKMLVFGGAAGGASSELNTGGSYNPSTDSWTLLSTINAPSRRQSVGLSWTGSRMVAFGGVQLVTYLNSGASYNPDNDTWSALSTMNVPVIRAYHSQVWTGSQVFVFGGTNGMYQNTGGLYTP